MSEYTPEPWPYFVDVCEPASPHPDSDAVVRMSYEDYKRAMICVNACKGLDTDVLDIITTLGETLLDRFERRDSREAELVIQRNSLLLAMKRIAAYPETRQQELGIESIRAIARVAIEKAEGDDE